MFAVDNAEGLTAMLSMFWILACRISSSLFDGNGIEDESTECSEANNAISDTNTELGYWSSFSV